MKRAGDGRRAGGADGARLARATPRQARWLRAGVLCAFFVSGLCGLVQEVAWTRLLRHIMGNSTLAITTVLCVFMGGLALGSYLGGRWIDRRRDPLRVFAILEGSIGFYCFFLPWLIPATEPIYRFLYQHTETTYYLFGLVRFGFCGTILLAPTVLMGATLPVLARAFAPAAGKVGSAVGLLYGINTFGAVAGAAVAGFLLMPNLGTALTIRAGCLLSGTVCAAALLLYRRSRRLGSEPGADSPPPGAKGAKPGGRAARTAEAASVSYGRAAVWAVLVGYGLSGFAALVLEIAWTRVLSLMIGSSVYAFSLMLTAFILGLAVGSVALAGRSDRVRDPMRLLAILELAIGASALAVVPLFERLPLYMAPLISGLRQSFWMLESAEFALVLAIMLVPTTLMGAALPLAMRLFAQGSQAVGRSVGTLYAYNTLGSILGSFAGGFLLVPLVGLQSTIVAAAGLSVAVGGVLLLLAGSVRRTVRMATAGAAVAAVAVAAVAIPPWNVGYMTSGPFFTALRTTPGASLSADEVRTNERRYKVLFHKEGLGATVTVKETPEGMRTLYAGGKPDASTFIDLPTQLLVAHVPMLMHPDPQDVVVIGLASGITLGSAGCYGVKTLDCVEIAPPMVEASHYFDEWNRHILSDPRVRLILNDGRNHLALTAKRYDVIISEPTNAWIAGVGDLFTREYFELCRDRMTDRGVACVWLQGYQMLPDDFRSVVATFRSVFPEMTMWSSFIGDYLLVGSKVPLSVDYAALAKRMATPAVAEDLAQIGIRSPVQLLGHLAMDGATAGRWASGAPLNTDDNARLEYSAPRGILTGNTTALGRIIHSKDEVDLGWVTGLGGTAPTAEALKADVEKLIRARRLMVEAITDLEAGRGSAALAKVHEVAGLNPDDRDLQNTVESQLVPDIPKMAEWPAERVRMAREVLAAVGQSCYNLSQLTLRYGRIEVAAEYSRLALRCLPTFAPAMNDLAWILATHPDAARRRPENAVILAEEAARLTQRRSPDVLDTLGVAYAAAGRFDDARRAADLAVALYQVAGDARMEQEVRARLELYKKGAAYRP